MPMEIENTLYPLVSFPKFRNYRHIEHRVILKLRSAGQQQSFVDNRKPVLVVDDLVVVEATAGVAADVAAGVAAAAVAAAAVVVVAAAAAAAAAAVGNTAGNNSVVGCIDLGCIEGNNLNMSVVGVMIDL